MKTTTRLALCALALAAAPLAFAKTTLVASSPAKDQALEAPPIELRLTFSERVEPRTCRIKLVSGDGRNVDADRPHADRSDPNSLVASVPVLRKGSWRARWTAVGADGHKLRGDFSFSIK
jgi:methionine-rich copper-binding protein CopC